MPDVVRADPDRLEAYSEATGPLTERALQGVADYADAVSAFNSASPNDLGSSVEDRSAAATGAFAAMRTLDELPAAFAAALRQVDSSGAAVLSAAGGVSFDNRVRDLMGPTSERMSRWIDGAGEGAGDFFSHPGTRGALTLWSVPNAGQTGLGIGRWTGARFDQALTTAVRNAHGSLRAFPRSLWSGPADPRVAQLRAGVHARWAPRLARIAAGMDGAVDLIHSGSGVMRAANKVVAPLAILSGAYTAVEGSSYDGARGTADRVISGSGAAATAGLLLVGAGAVAASPAIVVGLGVVAAGAAVWGIGNAVVDAWPSIERGAAATREWVADGGVGRLAEDAAEAGRDLRDTVVDGVADFGRKLAGPLSF